MINKIKNIFKGNQRIQGIDFKDGDFIWMKRKR